MRLRPVRHKYVNLPLVFTSPSLSFFLVPPLSSFVFIVCAGSQSLHWGQEGKPAGGARVVVSLYKTLLFFYICFLFDFSYSFIFIIFDISHIHHWLSTLGLLSRHLTLVDLSWNVSQTEIEREGEKSARILPAPPSPLPTLSLSPHPPLIFYKFKRT